MLSRCEGLTPGTVERDKDEHQALGVKRRPAEEERGDNNN